MCISRYHNSVHQIFEGCVQYFSSIHLYFPLNVGWIMFGKIRLADISFRGLGTIFVVQPRNFLLISSEYCKERMKQLQWPSQEYFEDFMKIFLITTCQLSRAHMLKQSILHQIISESTKVQQNYKLSLIQIVHVSNSRNVSFSNVTQVLNIKFKSEIFWKVWLSWLH